MLEAIQGGNEASNIKVQLLKRNKADGNKQNIENIIELIKANENVIKVGSLLKENPLGDTASQFNDALEEAKLERVEIGKGLELCISAKEESEIENIRWAGALSSKIFKLKFIEDMETIIDEDKKVKHSKMSDDLDQVFEDPSQIKVSINSNDIESCYAPIIQSGGNYDLRPSAQSNSDILKYDVIICSLGARYKGYCSNIARTYFISPTKSMERNYEILLEAQTACIQELRPGVSIQKVVQKIKKLIESKSPKLLPLLTKNLGFGIGLEFRESTNLLSAKNDLQIQEGMSFNVAFGFDKIPIPESQRKKHHPEVYSIFLADTVVVTNIETKVYTKMSKSWTKVHYDIDEDNSNEGEDDDSDRVSEAKKKDKKDKKKMESIHGAVDTTLAGGTRNQLKQSRLRDQQRALEGRETEHERREKHQAELMKRKREDAMRRIEMQGKEGQSNADQQKKTICAYATTSKYPSESKPKQIMVDMVAEAVLLPIKGIPVPFHISTIKNVSKSEEDKCTILRINFFAPGASAGRDCAPAMTHMLSKYDHQMFIKELGFRSVDAHNLNLQFRLIKELQKRVKQRQQQEKEESDLVVQENLILTRDRRVPRLSDLSAKPHLSGRKTQGTLEAHSNGLRFKSLKNEKLDVLYANIKHAIFQPCDNELVVLIHFHLKHHIMIGKKKQKDVQFYTEVMEASQNLDQRRRSMYDPDELDEENRERALRSKLNQTFKEFCRKVEQTAERGSFSLSFDIPYRELGFQGTPNKEMVLLQPTVNCLVNLTEFPFFLISLDAIEHVHFERVMFSSRNFDLVVVLKDFNVVPMRISAIPVKDLDSIREWLDDIDLCFTTGTANLNWKSIMLAVKDDDRFYLDTDEDGLPKPAGWEFLKMDGSDDDDDDEEDAESNYSEDAASDAASDESEGSDNSDWESIVDEDSEEEDEGGSSDDEEDEGESWEEMEKSAIAEERMKGKRDLDEFSPEKKSKSNKKKRR